jgi:hypothetical protein
MYKYSPNVLSLQVLAKIELLETGEFFALFFWCNKERTLGSAI